MYEPFFADFGPLNLGMTYRFVTELEKLITDSTYSKYLIYHYTSLDSAKKANAAYLMGAFQVIILKKTAEEAWKPFQKVQPPFADYRDASYGACTYKCTVNYYFFVFGVTIPVREAPTNQNMPLKLKKKSRINRKSKNFLKFIKNKN